MLYIMLFWQQIDYPNTIINADITITANRAQREIPVLGIIVLVAFEFSGLRLYLYDLNFVYIGDV